MNKLKDLIIKKFKLGIFMNQEKLVNHRSLIKIILNPLFRKFGYDIKSIVIYEIIKTDTSSTLIIKRIDYRFGKDKTNNPLKWDFYGNNMNQYNIWIPTIKMNNINYKIKVKLNETIS